jgi:hypothetical protein
MPTPLGYIDHRPFAGFGAGLIYGKRPDGSLVRVDEVPRGLACGCVCPAPDCAQPLIASKGPKVTHHFRHASGEAGCGSSAETSAHIWAKEILEREKAIWLPAIEGTYRGTTVTTHHRQRFHFDTVRLETRMGEVVPDVVLTKGERELIVEVQVTHACDASKIAKLIAAGVSALEVDLSAYRTSTDEEEVRGAILVTAPRRWLVNPKLEEARAAARDKAAALEAQKRRAAEAAAMELRDRLLHAPKMSEASLLPICDLVKDLGLGEFLEGPEPTLSGFAVTGPVWRAAVIQRVILPATAPGNAYWKPTVDPDHAAEAIRDLWALPLRPKISSDALSALARQAPGLVHPTDAVRTFVDDLVRDGLLVYDKGDFSVANHHRKEVRRVGKELDARKGRAADITQKVQSILKLARDDELVGFSLDDWMHRPPPGFTRAPVVLIHDGGEEFDRLESALHRVEPMPWVRAVPTDAVGLPVEHHLASEAEKQRLEQAAAEAAKKAEAEKARLGRLDRIRSHAAAVLGAFGEGWLDSPAKGRESTLREIAGDSDDGFNRVWNGIDRAGHERQLQQQAAAAMERRQVVLRRKAAAVLDEVHAEFFLTNCRNELRRRTPLEACDTDRGLDDAVSLLPASRRR